MGHQFGAFWPSGDEWDDARREQRGNRGDVRNGGERILLTHADQ